MEGRHKRNSLDLSLNQSLHSDTTFAMDLICEVFYKCIIQFLDDTQNIFYHCKITTVYLLFIQEILDDSNTNTPKKL